MFNLMRNPRMKFGALYTSGRLQGDSVFFHHRGKPNITVQPQCPAETHLMTETF